MAKNKTWHDKKVEERKKGLGSKKRRTKVGRSDKNLVTGHGVEMEKLGREVPEDSKMDLSSVDDLTDREKFENDLVNEHEEWLESTGDRLPDRVDTEIGEWRPDSYTPIADAANKEKKDARIKLALVGAVVGSAITLAGWLLTQG